MSYLTRRSGPSFIIAQRKLALARKDSKLLRQKMRSFERVHCHPIPPVGVDLEAQGQGELPWFPLPTVEKDPGNACFLSPEMREAELFQSPG